MFGCATRKPAWILAILLVTPLFSLYAQQQVSLADLVQLAKKNFPELLQKKTLVQRAEASVKDVRHSFLPELKINDQLTIGTDNALAGSYFPFGIIPSTSSGVHAANNSHPETGNIAILYGSYDLLDFGYRQAKIRNAGALVQLQEADLQQAFYTVEMRIARLYITLLKTLARLAQDQQNVARYEHIYAVIRALTGSGLRPGADSSLAKAALAGTHISLNQTLGNVHAYQQELAYLTGLSANSMVIDTSLLHMRDRRMQLVNQPAAGDGNPMVAYYKSLVDMDANNQALVAKSYLPHVNLTAGSWARGSGIAYNDDYKSLGTGLGFQRFNYLAGFSIQYDLFNGLHTHDKLQVARLETAAGEYALQQEKLAWQSASLQADNALLTSSANLQELMVQSQAAQDNYNQESAQYRAGITNLVDLTNAAYVLYKSGIDYAETQGDWYLAALDKAAATGNLDFFIQQIK